MIDKFGLSLLTMFGVGHIKYAPGTVASFVTCLIFYIFGENFFWENKLYILFFLIIVFFYSIIIIDKLSHLFEKKDPKEIVIDEFIGQSIPLIFLLYWDFKVRLIYPFELGIVASFILFRFFDIAKIFPINIIDKKIKNGLGVMLDDIIAGIYSSIIIYIILSIWF